MTDTDTTRALIAAAATVVAAVAAVLVKRVLGKSKKTGAPLVEGSGSAAVATSGRGGKSVAAPSSGGHNVILIDSPGATVGVPPGSRPGPALRIPNDGRDFIREESSEEIAKVLFAVPPLERDDLAQRAYVGKWARWTGEVAHISREVETVRRTAGEKAEKRAVYIVMGRGGPRGTAYFTAQFLESKRAAIGVLREGDMVEIEGKLASVGLHSVDLVDCSIIGHTKGPSNL